MKLIFLIYYLFFFINFFKNEIIIILIFLFKLINNRGEMMKIIGVNDLISYLFKVLISIILKSSIISYK